MDILSANQMMWTAFLIGHITPLAFIALYYFKYISKEVFSLYFIGVLVGFTWEIPFSLAGKSFHLILIDLSFLFFRNLQNLISPLFCWVLCMI